MPQTAYTAMSSDFGFIPRVQPLPFPEAVRQLPRHYRFVLTKPGLESFLAEMGLAEWKIVWFQLLLYTLVAALLGWLHTFLSPGQGSQTVNGLDSASATLALNPASALGPLLFIPLFFFAAVGLLYWLARAFGGHGIFVQQAYTTLLFLTPCGITVSVLGIIPFVGNFLSTVGGVAVFIYCLALQCFATLAVHQMSGGKAVAVVVIATLVLIPTLIAGLALWAFLLVAI